VVPKTSSFASLPHSRFALSLLGTIDTIQEAHETRARKVLSDRRRELSGCKGAERWQRALALVTSASAR